MVGKTGLVKSDFCNCSSCSLMNKELIDLSPLWKLGTTTFSLSFRFPFFRFSMYFPWYSQHDDNDHTMVYHPSEIHANLHVVDLLAALRNSNHSFEWPRLIVGFQEQLLLHIKALPAFGFPLFLPQKRLLRWLVEVECE